MDNPNITALADETYSVYVAGDSGSNEGPGACAYRLISPNGEVTEKTVRSKDTTSNRAVIGGAIVALNATPEDACAILISNHDYLTNSCNKYLQGWIKNIWHNPQGKAVKNDDLWKQLAALLERRTVTFRRVGGDDEDLHNREVKALARKGAKKADRRITASSKRGA